MRKCGRLLNKLAVFVLLLSMTVTMTGPVTGYAQDEPLAKEESEVGAGEEDKKEEEKQDPLDKSTSGPTDDSGDQEGTERRISVQNADETEQAATGNAEYDVNKPVIEDFEFSQQGQTLKDNSTIEFRMNAYDLDSGIQTIEIALQTGDRWNTLIWTADTWKYDAQGNQYTCEHVLGKVDTEKVEISQVRVIDQNSNYAEWSVNDESGNRLYWFNTEESSPIRVKSFKLEPDQAVLKENDKVQISLELEDAVENDWIEAAFAQKEGDSRYSFLLYREESSGIFKADIYVDKGMANGVWRLSGLEIDQAGVSKKLQIDNMESYSFTVEKEEADIEKPVIKSVTVDKNGQICRAGDAVNVTVEAEDNGQLSNNGYLYFQPTADIASGGKYVELTYDENAGMYRGILEITEDTYPCEWYVSYIDIRDSENNEAGYEEYTFRANYPYYIQVYNGNTFVNPTYELNIIFMALDEYGNWENVSAVHKENVERRQTLKEIGITLPETVSGYPGLTQTGWEDYYGTEITENTPVLENLGIMQAYASYDKRLVQADYNYIREGGAYGHESQILTFPKDTTYGEVRAEILDKAAPADLYEGLTFQRWQTDGMGGLADDEPLHGGMNYYYVTTVCDKNLIRSQYTYLDQYGNWSEESRIQIVEKGATYKTVIEEGRKYRPDDMLTESEYPFENWEYNQNAAPDENAEISDGITNNWMDYTAKYKGVNIAIVNRQYYDEEGRNAHVSEIVYAEEGAKVEGVLEKLKDQALSGMYEGLRFSGWKTDEPADQAVENWSYIYASAGYENCIIRYIIDPRFEDYEYDGDDTGVESIICQVAEKGELVTFPTSVEGYESVTWRDEPEEAAFTVNNDMTFAGYGNKTAADPDKPENPDPDKPENPDPEKPENPDPEKPENPENPDPEKPENPEKPDDPIIPNPDQTLPSNPVIELPESSVHAVVDTINKTEDGGQVRVDMGTATVVPKEVLESAKGKDVDVILNMGGYTWTINGQDIASNNLKDINLQVTVDTHNIPSSTVRQLAGDNPVVQLSLAHEGNFGFKAALTVTIGDEYAGKYGNLFYYDSAGKMVFIDAGRVNPDGSVTLNFSHASEYAVVMSDDPMSQASVPSGLQPANNRGKTSPRTGDNSKIMLLILCSALAMWVITCNCKKRRA